jgi:uncharacterized membrane protein
LLNVLWALGWAMIVLSLLLHPPVSLTAALGLVMIAGHNLLDSIQSSNVMWSILHSPNFILETQKHLCRISAHSLDWSYGRRLQPWANLCLDIPASENVPVAGWTRANGHLRDSSRHQFLR